MFEKPGGMMCFKLFNGPHKLSEKKRKLAITYAMHFIGTWYSWGGDDPSGFDCSGYIVEVLQAVGLLGRKEDLTADGLYRRFKNYEVEKPYAGCLVFWGSNKKKTHVELCIDEYHSIGASGGGRFVKTKEDAIKANAFIKIRPIDSRTGKKWFVDPFLKFECIKIPKGYVVG